MAVYTHITNDSLKVLLGQYDVGELVSFKGIAAGVENSNYVVDTTTGRYILTIYEKRTKPEDIPFFLQLMQFLQRQGVPCPTPFSTNTGELIAYIQDKPCALISFLQGKATQVIQGYHVEELGRHLAQLHVEVQQFPQTRPNNFSLHAWETFSEQIGNGFETIKPGLQSEVQDYMQHLQAYWPVDLPQGVIHADVFPDNVFFDGKTLVGIIDFYFACTDYLLYDVAICLNAWCFQSHKEFNLTKAKRFLNAYHAVRPIEQRELDALPLLAMGAAMRFLLTRSYDWINHDETATVTPHDPLDYLHIIRFHHGVTSFKQYGL